MSDTLRARLQRIADPNLQAALKVSGDRVTALEAQLAALQSSALVIGRQVDAQGNRIRRVADPQQGDDAVSLDAMRRYVKAEIKVAAGVPPRPTTDAGAPPTFPPPTGTFVAVPSTLGAPGNTTITWSSQNATSAESSLVGAIPLSGTVVVFLSVSTTATITLRGPGGVTTYQLTVTVTATPPPTPPPTGTFQAIPATAAPGAPTTLTWSSVNATTAVINQGVGAVTPVSGGTRTVTPTQTTRYELALTGLGGQTILATTVTVTSVVPPPVGYTASILGWGFGNSGVRYAWKGITAFAALHDLLHGGTNQTVAFLDYCAAAGVTVPRVLLSIMDNPLDPTRAFWEPKGYRLYWREHPDFFEKLGNLVAYCNSKGMMPEIVIFGTATDAFADQNERIAFTEAVARALLPYRGLFLQIANEYNQIGFTSADAVIELGNRYKAIDPTRVLSLSPPNGPGDVIVETNTAPADYYTVHIDRRQTPTLAQWVIRHYGNPTIMNGVKPAVSDEPLNAGYALYGAHEPDPQYWFAFGVMGQVMGWSGTFHYEGGLFNQLPGVSTAEEDCFLAWLLALSTTPTPDNGGSLFAAYPGGALGPSPWATSGANTALIGRVTAAGGGYALIFGASALPALLPGWTISLDLRTQPYSAIKGYLLNPIGF